MLKWAFLLADALVIPLTAKETVNDHNWVALRFAVVIVELECKIDNAQARGGVE